MSITKIRISKYDAEWSRIARKRSPNCEVCGKPGDGDEGIAGLNAHHFIRRAIKPTRLDLSNAIILCVSHHTFNHEFSAHKTPEAFKTWFRAKYPRRAQTLTEKAQTHMSEREAIQQFLYDYRFDSPALQKEYYKSTSV